jgi:methyl-accepting chemotaxis protein
MNLKRQSQVGVATLVGALLLAILVGGFGINKIRIGGPLQTEKQLMSDLLADVLPPPQFIIEPWLEVSLISDQHGNLAEHVEALKKLRADYEARKNFWNAGAMPDSLKNDFAATTQTAEQFWKVYDEKFLPAVSAGDTVARDLAHEELGNIYEEHRAAINKLVESTNAVSGELNEESDTILSRTLWVLAALGLGILTMLGGFAIMLNRRIVTPLSLSAGLMHRMAGGDYQVTVTGQDRTDEVGAMAKAMEVFRAAGIEKEAAQAKQQHVVQALAKGLDALAEGNLNCAIREPFASEYERLRTSFNDTVAGLDQSLSSVATSAQSVHNGSTEIRAASEDLARRTEQQAASLEETAAAMSQVTSMVGDSARGASDVRTSINSAHKDASDGGEVVKQAVTAMDAIERSSQEISQIINVIDGIAFQTNLLALNAGVEAARAGDAGKGFAVVANEVRALAQRSADAAKDIKGLITTSSEQVSSGVHLVGETGKMLDRIVGKISDINTLIVEIAHGTETQAANLQQVNSSVAEMDKMTQQNAAMVEESTAAARSLASEADQLAALVARFQLSSSAASGHRASAAPVQAVRRAPVRSAPMMSGNTALKVDDDADDWAEF